MNASLARSALDDRMLWQSCAPVYDGMLNILPYQNLLLEVINQSGLNDNSRLLDVCCGTGNIMSILSKQNSRCQVLGLDYTTAMLERASSKAKKYSGNATFREANLNNPASSWGISQRFDHFIFNNAAYLMRDPNETLRQLTEVAEAGAILVMSTPQANPSQNAVLDEHLRLAESIGIDRESAIRRITPFLRPLLECSTAVLERYGDDIHSPNRLQLQRWFENTGWNISRVASAYAGQNWLVVAQYGGR